MNRLVEFAYHSLGITSLLSSIITNSRQIKNDLKKSLVYVQLPQHALTCVILNLGDVSISGYIFSSHKWRVSCNGTWWVEATDANHPPTIHSTLHRELSGAICQQCRV